jgi:plasmid stabilization system protein ParE
VRTDIGVALALLAEQPGIGTAYQTARAQGIRRLFVGRIRYFIYYRATSDTLQVLAVWHVSRGNQPVL